MSKSSKWSNLSGLVAKPTVRHFERKIWLPCQSQVAKLADLSFTCLKSQEVYSQWSLKGEVWGEPGTSTDDLPQRNTGKSELFRKTPPPGNRWYEPNQGGFGRCELSRDVEFPLGILSLSRFLEKDALAGFSGRYWLKYVGRGPLTVTVGNEGL